MPMNAWAAKPYNFRCELVMLVNPSNGQKPNHQLFESL